MATATIEREPLRTHVPVEVANEVVPDVGVLVGRFQVPELHEGHRGVLDYVALRHDKVILFLGITDHGISTPSNPLPFEPRKQMIGAEYPEFNILYIKDEWSDQYWSKKLDSQIAQVVGPEQTVMLYGSRDSFLDHYVGRYQTQELEAEEKVSGTQIRAEIKRKRPINSAEWRMGATASAWARYPVCYPTVDTVPFNEDLTRVALVKKPNEPMWRICGGFAEATSPNFESDARREVMEEMNLSITDPIYAGSFYIDDWRYKGERDKIKTLLFVAKKQFGDMRADDDVEHAEWFEIDKIDIEKDIMPNHRPLLEAAIAKKDLLK